MSISDLAKKQLPAILVSALGTVIVLNKFFTNNLLNAWSITTTSWSSMIANVAIFAGLYGICKININHMKKEGTVRSYIVNGAFFAAIFITLILGFAFGAGSKQYLQFFDYIYGSLVKAIYSLMFFAVASAGYRGLRFARGRGILNTTETLLMYIGVAIYLLNSSPVVSYYLPWINPVHQLLFNYISRAAESGAVICIGAGALVYGVRLLTNTEVVLKRT
jgi:hypothetical protein